MGWINLVARLVVGWASGDVLEPGIGRGGPAAMHDPEHYVTPAWLIGWLGPARPPARCDICSFLRPMYYTLWCGREP